jgi:hypothetical protein
MTLLATVGFFATSLWAASIADRIIQMELKRNVMRWFVLLGSLREGCPLIVGIVFLLAANDGLMHSCAVSVPLMYCGKHWHQFQTNSVSRTFLSLFILAYTYEMDRESSVF